MLNFHKNLPRLAWGNSTIS